MMFPSMFLYLQRSMKYLQLILPFFLLTALLLIISPALAQAIDELWSEPVNLSQSGGTSNPVLVQDAFGDVHAVWQDEFTAGDETTLARSGYARYDGESWSAPTLVAFPFSPYVPLLVADDSGWVHAFWIDAEEGSLRTSRVLAAEFGNAFAWEVSRTLAFSALKVDAVVDDDGAVHLIYLRPLEDSDFPAGLYYRRSTTAGESWELPVTLYNSLYFRSLSAGEANLDIAYTGSGEDSRLYVTWDNPLRARVFLSKSDDGGQSWNEPLEVDAPVVGSVSATPSNLVVYAENEKILLIWQTGRENTSCSQYYQWSLDGGETWQPSQRLPSSTFGCLAQTEILAGEDGPILMTSSIQDYLQAWDGTRWSEPQIQTPLSSFSDPETQQNINLACLHTSLVENKLFVVGCATDEGGDIWWLQRSLDDIADWYPQESVWQPLTSITRSESQILSPALVADTRERLHVIWSQAGDDIFNQPESALHYTRWEDESLWSQPVSILSSPEEPSDQPAVTIDPTGRLLIVWRHSRNGEIFFSYADANQAALPSAWSDPLRLSAPGQMSSAPDIFVTEMGEIYVVYAVPINEGRGVYLTHSADGGESWSDPTLVFDGAAAGWAMLDLPHLALTSARDIHLIWTNYQPASGQPKPLTLAYVHSQDGGATWPEGRTVVEAPVIWSRVLGADGSTLHLFWQELTAGQAKILWHERSLDNGQTWERIAPISIFGQTVGNPSLTWDSAGRLHLSQVVDRGTGSDLLQHWIWDGERWSSNESLDLDLESDTNINSLNSAATSQGDLAVILSGSIENTEFVRQEDQLYFTARSIESLEGEPLPPPPAPVTPVVTDEPTLEPTALPTLTPTPDLAALSAELDNPGSSQQALIFGSIMAGLIVAVAFGYGVKKLRDED